ncbi:MAG: prolipoprotein diacylglyceryl transferase [Flammeovirgaceae bacterium]|nr:prolipoprotein diacylglyceryl transferase [Flammeovirgaceae bacterium]
MSLRKLQQKWNLQSAKQVILVLIVFALTGSTVLLIKPFLFRWLGQYYSISFWNRIWVSVLVILPLYQVLLLFYGLLLGQFTFFWNFERRMIGRIFFFFHRKNHS